MTGNSDDKIYEEALRMHAEGRPGKLAVRATKPLTTQYDLTLAYSPGVAAPCLAIAEDERRSYVYTARGNVVGVLSNGTAVLGLGNIGAAAARPVMEGKSVLFKRFADIDGVNVEIDTPDVDEFVDCAKYLGKAFGGINLEDIKAPECFVIEERLKELLDIPVFHDDQHGTAIITAAGLINGLHLTGRDIKNCRIVVNGAGAASIACLELFNLLGMPAGNAIVCDSKGVIYEGRAEGMNQWKSKWAAKTDARTLAEAMRGADCFVGVSVEGAVTGDMVKDMAADPLIFAMANPAPEIWPEEVAKVRSDAIMATGRSDYPNQINNVLCFPFLFRGALDVHASAINEEMKVAAAHALANLAREHVPEEVDAIYGKGHLSYGRDYLIPTPFDPRLIVSIPKAVAKAAMDSGVARKQIKDMAAYEVELAARMDPLIGGMQGILNDVKKNPKRVVFAEGEEEKAIRAAYDFQAQGFGAPILVGREEIIDETIKALGLPKLPGIEISNARLSAKNEVYTDFLYERLQRKGSLRRDCQRRVNQNRNIFAACMVGMGDADAMVTGLTRHYGVNVADVEKVLGPDDNSDVFGLSLLLYQGRMLFVADTALHELPSPEQLAAFAAHTASIARSMGQTPRVAFLSYGNFGNPDRPRTQVMRAAVAELDKRDHDFEFDGEMAVDTALNPDLLARYPFCRLTQPANVLIMPGLHAARISTRMLGAMGAATVIGPLMYGFDKPAQIVPMSAGVSDLVTVAALAAHQAHTGE